jgi:hypothetical protein
MRTGGPVTRRPTCSIGRLPGALSVRVAKRSAEQLGLARKVQIRSGTRAPRGSCHVVHRGLLEPAARENAHRDLDEPRAARGWLGNGVARVPHHRNTRRCVEICQVRADCLLADRPFGPILSVHLALMRLRAPRTDAARARGGSADRSRGPVAVHGFAWRLAQSRRCPRLRRSLRAAMTHSRGLDCVENHDSVVDLRQP